MFSDSPKISVIVPVYKAEAYLHRCVDSLLAQTFQDFEVLLVDDGSPDRSGEICDEYARKDSRVRVFHKENGGVSSARNLGLDNAKGKWITFVDSDDYVDPIYLDNFGFENLRADIYLQGYKVEIDKEIVSQHIFATDKHCLYPIERLFVEGESKNILNSPCCKLFDINIIRRYDIYFDLNISYGEDHLFVLEYLFYTSDMAVSPSDSYTYILCNELSLTKRLVPYQELIYYITESRKLQSRLLDASFFKSSEVRAILNRRAYWTFILSVKSFFHNQISLKLYYEFKKRISKVEFGYTGLHIKQKIILFLFLVIQPYFIYYLLNPLIKKIVK